jgi:hypothetical protein
MTHSEIGTTLTVRSSSSVRLRKLWSNGPRMATPNHFGAPKRAFDTRCAFNCARISRLAVCICGALITSSMALQATAQSSGKSTNAVAESQASISNDAGAETDLALSSSSIYFPAQQVDTLSSPQKVTLTNTTDKALEVKRIDVSVGYSIGEIKFPYQLKSKEVLPLVVTFQPTKSDKLEGSLVIVSDSGASPQKITLVGVAIPKSCVPHDCISTLLISMLLCVGYWVTMIVVRWHRIALPTRELLRAQINSLDKELDLLLPALQQDALSPIRELLQKALSLIDRTTRADRLFWSRGQEITGWGYVHEVEIKMARFRDSESVVAHLEDAERDLRATNDASDLGLANSIHQALITAGTSIARLRELLASALGVNYDRADNGFADLVSWQNKTSWLVFCGLSLIVALSTAFPNQSVIFVVGAAGGLISRLSRSLERKDVPTDYGASWTTLFLSPVAGALGAWAGILLATLASELKVLGTAFVANWDHPTTSLSLAIALLFGFSERLLDSVLDKLEQAGGVPKAASTNPQPPQVPASNPVPVANQNVPSIFPDSLPDATVGQPYAVQLTISPPSTTPAKWTGGALPDGIKIDAAGKISGIPTTATQTPVAFAIQCELSDTIKPTKTLTISVKPSGA